MSFCEEEAQVRKLKWDGRMGIEGHLAAFGPSGLGKTHCLLRLLRDHQLFFRQDPKLACIIICYEAWQPVYKTFKEEMASQNLLVTLVPLASFQISQIPKYRAGSDGHCVLLVDDGGIFITKNSDFADYLTRARHHRISFFFAFHRVFYGNNACRLIVANLTYFIFCGSRRLFRDVRTLDSNLGFDGSLSRCFRKVCEHEDEKYPLLLLDMSIGLSEDLRLRTRFQNPNRCSVFLRK